MCARTSTSLVIERLVEGSETERDAWLDQAAASLSLETLHAYEQRCLDYLARRYPNDPGSLTNWRYLVGRGKRRALRGFFDRAQDRLMLQLVGHVEAIRGVTLAHGQAVVDDRLYHQRRPLARARRQAELQAAIDQGLSENDELQHLLALEEGRHRRAQDAAKQASKLEKDRLKVVAKLERAQRRLDQPQQLLTTLYQVLQALVQYQMSLNDRALRNPALADRLRMMSLGLGAVMTSVQGLIAELNAQGGQRPDDEQLRQQSEQILNLAMEQMQQWQQESTDEPPLASS